MIACGRCGEPTGIGGFGSSFRIFETFACDGQKMSVCIVLCDRCQEELVEWLNEGEEMNDYTSHVSQIVRTDENG